MNRSTMPHNTVNDMPGPAQSDLVRQLVVIISLVIAVVGALELNAAWILSVQAGLLAVAGAVGIALAVAGRGSSPRLHRSGGGLSGSLSPARAATWCRILQR